MSHRAVGVALAIVELLLILVTLAVSLARARSSAWATVIATGSGLQAIVNALVVFIWLGPSSGVTDFLVYYIGVWPQWGSLVAMLAVAIGVTGLWMQAPSKSTRVWPVLAGEGVALHACLLVWLHQPGADTCRAIRTGRERASVRLHNGRAPLPSSLYSSAC